MKLSEKRILEAARSACGHLIRPNLRDATAREKIVTFLSIEPEVSEESIGALIEGDGSFEPRLIGLALAVRNGPEKFIGNILNALKSPRGLTVVASFAAVVTGLEVLRKLTLPKDFELLDRSTFDGDMGWALDKAKHHLLNSTIDPGGNSPNDAISFERHLETYRWIRDRFPDENEWRKS